MSTYPVSQIKTTTQLLGWCYQVYLGGIALVADRLHVYRHLFPRLNGSTGIETIVAMLCIRLLSVVDVPADRHTVEIRGSVHARRIEYAISCEDLAFGKCGESLLAHEPVVILGKDRKINTGRNVLCGKDADLSRIKRGGTDEK